MLRQVASTLFLSMVEEELCWSLEESYLFILLPAV